MKYNKAEMSRKIQIEKYWNHLKGLRDVRMVGLLVFTVLVLLVSWSGVGVIQANYELQKKIANLEQAVALNELENSNLELRNQYYETDQYLELQARRQFGLAAPGERLFIVPKHVALAYGVEPVIPPPETVVEEPEKPLYQENFEAWMDFLFRPKS